MVLMRSFEFDPFHIDLTKRVLLKEGHPVPLLPKTFDLLEVLVQHSGQLMRENDLMQMVWPDTFVEEGNLTQNISLLRKALGARLAHKPLKPKLIIGMQPTRYNDSLGSMHFLARG